MMKWNNQRGVTLVELLVVIVLMGAILTPITFLVNHSLSTERDVSVKNELQREARFIIGQISEKMRDSDNHWIKDEEKWVLCEYRNGNCDLTHLTYAPLDRIIYMGDESGRILADTITLTLEPEPVNTLSIGIEKQKVIVEIEERDQSIKLETTIYFDRF